MCFFWSFNNPQNELAVLRVIDCHHPELFVSLSHEGPVGLAAVAFGRWRPGGVLAGCAPLAAAEALQFRLQAGGDVP